MDPVGDLGCHAGGPGRRRSRCHSPANDRQHQHPRTSLCRRRKRGTHRQGLGRSRGGFTTKLHAATNAYGLPLGLLITPGETHDARVATDLTDSVAEPPLALLGDKGYDSDDIRHEACFHGTMPMIPTKSNRKVQFTVDRAIYSLRNRIERFFNRLKNARRVSTRYDKTADSFLGFVQITSIRTWLQFVNRT
jgi:transposase